MLLRFALLRVASDRCTNRCTVHHAHAAGNAKRARTAPPGGPQRSPATPRGATVSLMSEPLRRLAVLAGDTVARYR